MYLDDIVQAQHRGEARGIPSVCSAHPDVLKAALRLAAAQGMPPLIEATCNQVNQFGGYTALTPADFAGWVRDLAAECSLPAASLILGGDHLGPSPWQNETAASAMHKAADLVQAFVGAGFTKIHLDCSMRLADDPPGGLDSALIAERTAHLCAVSEAAGAGDQRYVIGSEVPIPGGALEGGETTQVTQVDAVSRTLELHRKAFHDRGLQSAWDRVIAIVVQPGVEFGDDFVFAYNPRKAEGLSRLIESHFLVYEAHSTDYQAPGALRDLVRDHFAILKVGPALTFAYRQALFDLSALEDRLVPKPQRSDLLNVLEQEMLRQPGHWQKYYTGTEAEQAAKRRHSRSDRIRYYWRLPRVQEAVQRLMTNLAGKPISPEFVQDHSAAAVGAPSSADAPVTAATVVSARISAQLLPYFDACRPRPAPA